MKPPAYPRPGLYDDREEALRGRLVPGEALLWSGRGRMGATARALVPNLLLIALVLGPLAWGFATADLVGWGRESRVHSESARWTGVAIPASMFGYYACLTAWRITSASRLRVAVTSARLLLVTPRLTRFYPVEGVRAQVYGSAERPVLRLAQRGGTGRASFFGVADIAEAIVALERAGVPTRDRRRRAAASPEPAGLALGEPVRWSARCGVGAIGGGRWMMIAVSTPWPLLVAWLLWRSLSQMLSPGAVGGPAWGALSTVGVLAILGPAAFFILREAGPFLDDILVDAFGRLTVTDRRILFVRPLTGVVDREIGAATLIDVVLADEGDHSRGHLHLIMRGKVEGKPVTLDLFAVPQAAAAVAAMKRLIR